MLSVLSVAMVDLAEGLSLGGRSCWRLPWRRWEMVVLDSRVSLRSTRLSSLLVSTNLLVLKQCPKVRI